MEGRRKETKTSCLEPFVRVDMTPAHDTNLCTSLPPLLYVFRCPSWITLFVNPFVCVVQFVLLNGQKWHGEAGSQIMWNPCRRPPSGPHRCCLFLVIAVVFFFEEGDVQQVRLTNEQRRSPVIFSFRSRGTFFLRMNESSSHRT